ncbi:dentin sialophosphoprotein isoform X2 [Thunnus maccoyii]|uniref:dentin sialophosphoprotein isoform X2 n=1 Tax=Thunnus maccoyii TaxID=8240 RepID=UPI001C4C844E|nr:dentin sialophosphoprotein isoform X2 [Thunnus maccoyii]
MKKLWSCLCFLVLAVLPISRGQDTTVSQHNSSDHYNHSDTSMTTTKSWLDETTDATNNMSSSSSQNSETLNVTTPAQNNTGGGNNTPVNESSTTLQATTTSGKKPGNEGDASNGSVTTATTSSSSVIIEDKDSSSWGYVILVLIILVIIILCVILYLLRRVSRTYSFDLQRPSPASHCNEPTGTFEPVYLDDLDQTAPEDRVNNDYTPPPTLANGTTPQSEEKDSSGENAPQDQTDTNGFETLSIGINSPPADIMSDQLMNTDIFFNGSGEEQQNENNNNPCETVCVDIHNTMEPSSGVLQ